MRRHSRGGNEKPVGVAGVGGDSCVGVIGVRNEKCIGVKSV